MPKRIKNLHSCRDEYQTTLHATWRDLFFTLSRLSLRVCSWFAARFSLSLCLFARQCGVDYVRSLKDSSDSRYHSIWPILLQVVRGIIQGFGFVHFEVALPFFQHV